MKVDHSNGRTTMAYDAGGNLTSITQPDGSQATFSYDAINEVIRQSDYFGHIAATAYDAVGRVTATTDGLNHTTTFAYDAVGQQTTVIDALNHRTTYIFDAAGHMTNVIDGLNNKSTFVYDAAGQKTQMTDALGHSATYAYDAAGRLSSSTDRDGRRINYSYDDVGRESGETWLASGGGTDNILTFTFDAVGNLTQSANNAGTYTMAYDAINRMTLVNEPFGQTMTMVYDNIGNRTEVQDGTGVEDSVYDAHNNLTSRTYSQSGTAVVHFQQTFDAHRPGDRPVALCLGLARALVATTSLIYDDLNRITNMQHKAGTGTNIANFTYTYDAGENVSTEIANGTIMSYSYDAVNELLNAGTTFTYDADGNRTGYTTGNENELTTDTTWTYAYDAEGNETSKTITGTGEKWTYTYDERNHLTKAEHISTTGGAVDKRDVYIYDAFGNRIEQEVGVSSPVVTRFAMDGWDPAKPTPIGNENWDIWGDLNGSNAADDALSAWRRGGPVVRAPGLQRRDVHGQLVHARPGRVGAQHRPVQRRGHLEQGRCQIRRLRQHHLGDQFELPRPLCLDGARVRRRDGAAVQPGTVL